MSTTSDGWFGTGVQTTTVTLPQALPSGAKYQILFNVEDADDILNVGIVYTYDKTNTNFKIAFTGNTDNVDIRYTIIYDLSVQ